VHDRASAEDVLEATFIELLQHGSTIQGGAAAIKVWLYKAAHFNALDLLRKRTRLREDLQGDDQVLDLEDPVRGPAEHAEAAELGTEVRAALTQLSEDQRQVLELRYIAGLSAKEIAELMDKGDGAVRSLQHRGERALAKLLRPLRPPAPSQRSAASKDVES
jgi:RNA polymerase sigma-70 factor (ECF subfamily)